MPGTVSGWLSSYISVSASHARGHELAPRSCHTKDDQKWYKPPPYLKLGHWGRSLAVQPDFIGNINGDMHFKDVMGSIARVGYCIPVPHFYLVVHYIRCPKNTPMNE